MHPDVLVLRCSYKFVHVCASVTKPPSAVTLAHRPQDWHLACEFPDYQAYTCPAVFQDDWLNEWFDWQQRQQQEAAPAPQQAEQADVDGQQQQSAGAGGIQASDYRFVYLGPAVSNQDSVTAAMPYNGALLRHSSHPSLTAYPWAGASAHWFVPHALLLQGTSTPLHADVLRSFSWSANIAGRKLWRLLPPQVPMSFQRQCCFDKLLCSGQTLPPDTPPRSSPITPLLLVRPCSTRTSCWTAMGGTQPGTSLPTIQEVTPLT